MAMASRGTGGTDDYHPHHPSRQTSTNDQLAAIAHFLDELELKTPIKHLQKESDGNKALLDTINALISVGAFIAGVQAQVIGLANGSNARALERATNGFAFVGLALDLIGTSAGVARALLLQASIRRSHRLAVRLAGQIDGAHHQLRELQRRSGVSSSNTSTSSTAAPAPVSAYAYASPADEARARAALAHSVRGISRVMAVLAEDGRFGVQAAEQISELQAEGAAALDALLMGQRGRKSGSARRLFGPLALWGSLVPRVHVEGLGYVPVAALAGGALCLFASVLLFAGASQPHFIWISCIAIIVSMFACSVIPETNAHKRKHAVFYDRVEDVLEQCPPVKPPVYSAPQGTDLGK